MNQGNPVIQVRGSSLLLYDEPVRLYSGAISQRRQDNMRCQQKKQYSGGMTQGSRKRLAKAVTVMSQAIKPGWVTNPCTQRMQYHKFSFITLTVASPENITAREAYDGLLCHFLDWMTRTMNVKTYIWKAELQERGQIHYHITSPALIHWKVIRDKWNDLQRRAGLLDDYAKDHGHFSPNSTDIHDTRHVKNADRYLLKELNKTVSAVQVKEIAEVKRKFRAGEITSIEADLAISEINAGKINTVGKIWGCSADLSGIGYFTTGRSVDHDEIIEGWVKEGKARRVRDDWFEIIYCDGVDPPDLLNLSETKNFEKYLKWVLDRNEQPETIPEACVQMELADVTREYTIDQLQLFLN